MVIAAAMLCVSCVAGASAGLGNVSSCWWADRQVVDVAFIEGT